MKYILTLFVLMAACGEYDPQTDEIASFQEALTRDPGYGILADSTGDPCGNVTPAGRVCSMPFSKHIWFNGVELQGCASGIWANARITAKNELEGWWADYGTDFQEASSISNSMVVSVVCKADGLQEATAVSGFVESGRVCTKDPRGGSGQVCKYKGAITILHGDQMVADCKNLKLSTTACARYFAEILKHEYSHDAGLPHNNVPGSLMYPVESINATTTRINPLPAEGLVMQDYIP